jgi:hypothetical protein
MERSGKERYLQCSCQNLNWTIQAVTDHQYNERDLMTMKNGVFWDVTPCGSYKNGRFGLRLHHQGDKNR